MSFESPSEQKDDSNNDSVSPLAAEQPNENNKSYEGSGDKSEEKASDPQPMDVEDVPPQEDEEFHPSTIAEVDDETTMQAEEKLGQEMSHEEEMALLQKENEKRMRSLSRNFEPCMLISKIMPMTTRRTLTCWKTNSLILTRKTIQKT
jgi:hypothetical protein